MVALATGDPAGFAAGVASLARIYELRVERPLRAELDRLIAVEFRDIRPEDVSAVDESVKSVIESSSIDATLAAARPREVVAALMANGGSQVRAQFASEDLSNLFDQFLLTAIREIGRAWMIRPGFALDASTRALREVGDAASEVASLKQDVARAVRDFSTELAQDTRVPVQMAVSGHRRALDEYIPERTDPRSEEIDLVRRFIAGESGQWWGWRGEAWSGKSTLMALTLRAIEEEHSVVPFFISGRQINSRERLHFLDRTLPRLAQLCGEESVPATTKSVQVDVYHGYLLRAAAACADVGQRLVLLIDGLDEDAEAHKGSILATIPVNLPDNVRVIVASRPVALPTDIHETHPLKSDATWHRLAPSTLATAAQSVAERDVTELLGTELGRQVAEVLAAAGAPLSMADLAELVDAPPAKVREQVIRDRVGRCLAAVSILPIDPRDSGPMDQGYTLAHEEIFRQIVLALQPRLALVANTSDWQPGVADALTFGRSRIIDWADRWATQGWPSNTPRYLIREYADLLATANEGRRLLAMATSLSRRDLLMQAWGVPWRAQQELAEAVRLAAAANPIDLATIASACTMIRVWMPNSYFIDPRMPETWARLGRIEYADYLCKELDWFAGREARARLLRLSLIEGDSQRAARLEKDLGEHSTEDAEIVRGSVERPLTAETVDERVIPTDDLTYDEDWDLREEAHVLEEGSDPSSPSARAGEAWTSEELDSMSQEQLALELLAAANHRDRAAVVRIAERLGWEMAGRGSPGDVSNDGRAFARALVRLDLAEDVLPVLKAQAAPLRTREALTSVNGACDDEEAARWSRAENAAWMMMHIALALRRSGRPAEGDRTANQAPDTFPKEEYLEFASTEAAAQGDFQSAISYLLGVRNQESIASTLAKIALLASWKGDTFAADIAKAAETAAQNVHVSAHMVRILHAFAGEMRDAGDNQLLENLIDAAGALLEHVEHPDEAWRLIQKQAELIRRTWDRVDGGHLISRFRPYDIASLVHAGLAYDSALVGDAAGVATHLESVSDTEDQWRVSRGLVHMLSPQSQTLLDAICATGPGWIRGVIDEARDDLLEDAARWPQQQPACDDDGLPSWVSGQERVHFERALAELARINHGDEVHSTDADAALDDVVADPRYSDEAHDLICVILKKANTPAAISAVRDAIARGSDEPMDSQILRALVQRALELDDEVLATTLIAAEEDADHDDALEVVVQFYLQRNDEESAELYARALDDDYARARAYKELAIHALRVRRTAEAVWFKACIPAEYTDHLREVRQVEFALAADEGRDLECQRLLATDMLESPLDAALLAQLASVSPGALASAARVAISEALERQRRLTEMTVVETLAAKLSC